MALLIHYDAAERINLGYFRLERGVNAGDRITPERVIKASIDHGDVFVRRLPHMRFVLDGQPTTYEHLASLAGGVLARRAAGQGDEQGAGESPPPPQPPDTIDHRGADVADVLAVLDMSPAVFVSAFGRDLAQIPLADASYNAARSAISRTDDLDALRTWRSAEARDSVIGLIDARLAKLA